MAKLGSRAKLLLLVGLIWQFAANGWAEIYPTKTVRYVVSDSAGGFADALARVIAAGLTEVWSQQVIVENRTGAATVAVLKRPEVARRMQDMVVTPVGDQSEEFAAFIKSEIDKWGKIIRAMGLTAN